LNREQRRDHNLATLGGALTFGERRLLIHAIVDHWESEFGADATIMSPRCRLSRSTALPGRR
jgi:hypothetical protein